jgi:hypothetical protein
MARCVDHAARRVEEDNDRNELRQRVGAASKEIALLHLFDHHPGEELLHRLVAELLYGFRGCVDPGGQHLAGGFTKYALRDLHDDVRHGRLLRSELALSVSPTHLLCQWQIRHLLGNIRHDPSRGARLVGRHAIKRRHYN